MFVSALKTDNSCPAEDSKDSDEKFILTFDPHPSLTEKANF